MEKDFRPWAKALRSLCLKKLTDFGGKGTARQIADDIGKDIKLIGPRMSELAELGAIRDSGERISAGRGRPQVVWEVVELGLDTTQGRGNDFAAVRESDAPAWFKHYGN